MQRKLIQPILIVCIIVGAVAALVLLFSSSACAEPMKVLPPWTMRTCPTEFYATYDSAGALELKKRDNDCALWRDVVPLLRKQVEDYATMTTKTAQVVELYRQSQIADTKRITDLVTQLKDEIAEKNKYKYAPSYAWRWGVIGGGVALVATGVAIGVGVSH